MTPRARRLAIALGVLVALTAATVLTLNAFRSNLVFFHTPTEVAEGKVPRDRPLRIGGMVREGSVRREGVNVRFVVTDMARDITVRYTGTLPDLFKEGKGVVAQGRLGPDGQLEAQEVLAKHDENYMPPEAAQALRQAQAGGARP
jgi:cytochrome c-type biogenesis protein CcmE